jgi:hypothetical protein
LTLRGDPAHGYVRAATDLVTAVRPDLRWSRAARGFDPHGAWATKATDLVAFVVPGLRRVRATCRRRRPAMPTTFLSGLQHATTGARASGSRSDAGGQLQPEVEPQPSQT